MMRMMVPLPLRATEAICPNKKLLEDNNNNNDDDNGKIHCIYHLIDCSPVAIYSRFGLIVRHRISPSCPSNPNKIKWLSIPIKNQMKYMVTCSKTKWIVWWKGKKHKCRWWWWWWDINTKKIKNNKTNIIDYIYSHM